MLLVAVAGVWPSPRIASAQQAAPVAQARGTPSRVAAIAPRPERAAPSTKRAPGAPERLAVEGTAPAYFYAPLASRGLKPVMVYLHGRGGNPELDCTKWGQVAREFGWILCPSGPEDRGGGARGWANNWMGSKEVVDRAVAALRERYGRRVQLRGNTLIGFSEGAFVAMNVGVREPETFNRWLILAANDSYWGGEGQEELVRRYSRIKRVYLLTGEQDAVVDCTRRVFDILDQAGVHVIMRTPEDLAHEIPQNRMRRLYRRPLRWLNSIE